MEQYLQQTKFFDVDSPIITEIISKLDLEGLTDTEKAIKLFYYVRDSIRYSIKPVNMDPKTYTASHVLQQDMSFCIPKAIALGTLARAVGIPSRLHFVDFVNHRLSESLEDLWGTKLMAGHCYSELFLDGRWVKATPSLDKATCDKHDFKLVEFDGIGDALLKSEDLHGEPHAEYVVDHGTFEDLNLKFLIDIFQKTYGGITQKSFETKFRSKVSTFE